MSVWNGHHGCTCHHPLFVFNQFGDLERCAPRPGNGHSGDGWEGVLKPVVERYRGTVSRICFRADAGVANPDLYGFLEAVRIRYAMRLPANRVLQDRIGYLLTPPVRGPPNHVRRSPASFCYQAGSWKKPRRVVAKVGVGIVQKAETSWKPRRNDSETGSCPGNAGLASRSSGECR